MGCTASSVSTPAQEPSKLPTNNNNNKAAEVKTEAMERPSSLDNNSKNNKNDNKSSADVSGETAAVQEEEAETSPEAVDVSLSLSPSPSTPQKQPLTEGETEGETDAQEALLSTPASTSAEPSATVVKRARDEDNDNDSESVNEREGETEAEAEAAQEREAEGEGEGEGENSVTVDSIDSSEGAEPLPGTVDFATMLLDERVQALLTSGKTTEEKLLSLFNIYDEDGDARLSEKEVNDVVWMSEAAHTHTNSPVKESETETTAPLSLSLSAQPASEQTYIDSPAGSAPVTPFAEHVPAAAVSVSAEKDSAAVSLSATMEEADSAVSIGALSPNLTRAAGPANRKSKKLVHSPIAQSAAAVSSPVAAGALDDFTEPVAVSAVSAVSSPAPSTQSATTTPVNSNNAAAQRKAAISAKKAERRASEVEDLNIPHDLVPPQKKGFLRVNVLPASSKANKFHVLDAGVLYHLDSATSSAFSMDRKGISLQNRVLSVSDAQPSVMKLVRPAGYVSAEDGDDAVVEIGIRGNNSEERDEWIDAFQKHIAFAEVLATYRKPAV